MQLSLVNLAKKGRTLMVLVKSTVSNHHMLMLRDKLVDKYEFVYYDPIVEHNVIYREQKKLRTVDKPSKGGSD